MPHSVTLDSMVRIPLDLLSEEQIRQMKKSLTVVPVDFGYGTPAPIESFELSDHEIAVPVQWGLHFFEAHLAHRATLVNKLVHGHNYTCPRRPDPTHPKAPAGQAQFFDDVIAACEESPVVLACASTGTGKTATGLNTSAHFGNTTLIVVPTKELARQWREVEIPKHLGLTKDDVGIVEESVCNYRNKPFTVAVIHNLILKQFEPDFYTNFGMVIWDEAHKLGAPAFNDSTRKFPAARKLALTATPNRKDGCMKLITNYFGSIRAQSESNPMNCKVMAIGYQHRRMYPAAMPRARLINAICALPDRNEMMANVIFSAYRAGRHFIGLSDRISQLQDILEILHAKGVPEQHLALYTRTYTDELNRKQTTLPEELEHYRKHARIFLATYQMAREGLDIPRLNCGMFLSPTSDGVQAIGRVTRILPDKEEPIWYIVKDIGNQVLIRSYYSALRSLKGLRHVEIIGKV